ncbi:MAG: TolC family protein [Ignavibacteriales bacterium]|nr:TolC family protein [Ignavibacteriales bacterium]
MKRIRFGIVLLVFAWGASPAQEQLTLQRCVELSKAFSLKSRSSEMAMRASGLAHDELMKSRLPQLKVRSEISYAPSSGTFGYDPAITDGGQVGGRISLEQSLYDGGVRNLKSGQLTAEQSALTWEKDLGERDLRLTVEQYFIEGLQSQRAIELQQESARQLKEYLELVERLSKGGAASYTDVLKTQMQLQSTERSIQKARATLASTKYALAELMGGSIDTSFALVGSLGALFPDRQADGTPLDISKNMDIALAELNVNKSTFETELARSERLPVISAVADAGVLTSFDNLRLSAPERAGVYGYMVGITLEVPLFTWGATDLRVQQRELATQALTLQLEGVKRFVATEYQKTQLQLSKSAERLRSIRMSLKAADENFVLTKAKYAAGGVLSLEVLSAQQLLTDLKLEELETIAEAELLSAKLEQILSR